MISLGIDTSNYASSVAVVDTDIHSVLLHKKQFLPVKKGELGLRQQDAVFHHIKNLTEIFELVQKDFSFKDVQAIGVSTTPCGEETSYMPCFLVGKLVANAIGAAKDIPIKYTTHQMGHINSALFYLNNENLSKGKTILLHVSGGTTDLILLENSEIIKNIGSSNDLFAGQAVDRLGVKLGFSFPAGEYVTQLAEQCDVEFYPKVSVQGCSCNLSGLENQCDELLAEKFSREYTAKYCLSYIAHSLIKMIKNAQTIYGDIPVVFAGGVMSSTVIKNIITDNIENSHFVSPLFSQDNAIGVAVVAGKEV